MLKKYTIYNYYVHTSIMTPEPNTDEITFQLLDKILKHVNF